jgi:hypothetical protein
MGKIPSKSFRQTVAVGTPVVTRKKSFEADGRFHGTRNEAFRCRAAETQTFHGIYFPKKKDGATTFS